MVRTGPRQDFRPDSRLLRTDCLSIHIRMHRLGGRCKVRQHQQSQHYGKYDRTIHRRPRLDPSRCTLRPDAAAIQCHPWRTCPARVHAGPGGTELSLHPAPPCVAHSHSDALRSGERDFDRSPVSIGCNVTAQVPCMRFVRISPSGRCGESAVKVRPRAARTSRHDLRAHGTIIRWLTPRVVRKLGSASIVRLFSQ